MQHELCLVRASSRPCIDVGTTEFTYGVLTLSMVGSSGLTSPHRGILPRDSCAFRVGKFLSSS